MGASWRGTLSIWGSTVAALEEEVTVFAFGAMIMVKIFEKIEKSSELYGFWESTRAFDASLVKDDEQLKWNDCWKTQIFYRPSNSQDMWFISRAPLEPDTHPEQRLHSCLEASNVIFMFQEPRLNSNQELRLFSIESRISWQLRITSQHHWSSHLRLISVTTASVRVAFSHIQSTSLLLQLV